MDAGSSASTCFARYENFLSLDLLWPRTADAQRRGVWQGSARRTTDLGEVRPLQTSGHRPRLLRAEALESGAPKFP